MHQPEAQFFISTDKSKRRTVRLEYSLQCQTIQIRVLIVLFPLQYGEIRFHRRCVGEHGGQSAAELSHPAERTVRYAAMDAIQVNIKRRRVIMLRKVHLDASFDNVLSAQRAAIALSTRPAPHTRSSLYRVGVGRVLRLQVYTVAY